MIRFAILSAVVLSALLAAPPAGAHQDAQYWSIVGFDAGLCDKLKLSVDGELRFGDDMARLYYGAPNATFVYSFYDFFAAGVGYKQVFERIYSDEVAPGVGWNREYQPHVDARLSFAIGGFRFSNRNLMEIRILEGAPWGLRYRNRLEVIPPLRWTSVKIEPFAAEEIFVDVKAGNFVQNRLSAGLSAGPWDFLRLKLYYLWLASRKSSDWFNFQSLVTEIKFAF